MKKIFSAFLVLVILASCGTAGTNDEETEGGDQTFAQVTESVETEKELSPEERYQSAHDASYFAKDREVEMVLTQTYSPDGGETVSTFGIEVRELHNSEGSHSLKQINSSGENSQVTTYCFGENRGYYASGDLMVTGECTYGEYEKLYLENDDSYLAMDGYDSFVAEEVDDGSCKITYSKPNDATFEEMLEGFGLRKVDVVEVVEFDSSGVAEISPEGFFEREEYTFSATVKMENGNTVVISQNGSSVFRFIGEEGKVKISLPDIGLYTDVGSFRGYMLANNHRHDPAIASGKGSISYSVATPVFTVDMKDSVVYSGKLGAGYVFTGELSLDRTVNGKGVKYSMNYDGTKLTLTETDSAQVIQDMETDILQAYSYFRSHLGVFKTDQSSFDTYRLENTDGIERVTASFSESCISEMTEYYLGIFADEDYSYLQTYEKEITSAQAEMEFGADGDMTAITYRLQISYKDAGGAETSLNIEQCVTEITFFE